MSRIGNKIVILPAGVTVTQDGNNITVKGPKGELTREFSADITMNIEGSEVTFTRPNDSKDMKTIHGTTRANFNNMVVGVSEGFEKGLELIGVGYRAQLQGSNLILNVGYSHPVEITPPAGVTVEVPSNTQVVVKGANKEHVGELAANIRGVRPPEPYKGKGIRYVGEFVRRKEGKTGK
ncbi:50S ribosomal protein L6 [Enterococcus rivorum]|uniref:Large ribosomal subunit protein uL6 n=1 Tax=Enterococcus rivorum TaxID=762845 RepID=A0A1E5L1R9_9ENTE|nr:50S ribosomal protein L6 [Enterococcus rivorum]MBP2097795.1 large subunit ribosomal protein L6 [Enterococcus rivorum]OEH84057.1 50S ribosomal protein L6 [Enterococcus rivorum]